MQTRRKPGRGDYVFVRCVGRSVVSWCGAEASSASSGQSAFMAGEKFPQQTYISQLHSIEISDTDGTSI